MPPATVLMRGGGLRGGEWRFMLPRPGMSSCDSCGVIGIDRCGARVYGPSSVVTRLSRAWEGLRSVGSANSDRRQASRGVAAHEAGGGPLARDQCDLRDYAVAHPRASPLYQRAVSGRLATQQSRIGGRPCSARCLLRVLWDVGASKAGRG